MDCLIISSAGVDAELQDLVSDPQGAWTLKALLAMVPRQTFPCGLAGARRILAKQHRLACTIARTLNLREGFHHRPLSCLVIVSWSSYFAHADRLFGCRLMLEGIGWQVAQFGMQPYAVVKADDVVGDVSCGFRLVGVVALPYPLHLQVQEEALHHRVVPTVALAAHAADQPVFVQHSLMRGAGVLAAAI